MKRVAIVVPAHNEEKRIGSMLEEYLSYFREVGEFEFCFIVVCNACADDTFEFVRRFCEKGDCDREINILDFERGGKGFAIIEGFKEALKGDWDYIGFVDADGSTPPSAFHGLINNISKVDGVIANRWDKRSHVVRQTWVRRIVSRGFNYIIKSLLLFPYVDTQCGAKLFRSEVIRAIVDELCLTHWAFDVNLLYSLRKAGFKVIEIPTEWNDREGSNINLKSVPALMFVAVVRLRLLNSRFKHFIRLYDGLPRWVKVHNIG